MKIGDRIHALRTYGSNTTLRRKLEIQFDDETRNPHDTAGIDRIYGELRVVLVELRSNDLCRALVGVGR